MPGRGGFWGVAGSKFDSLDGAAVETDGFLGSVAVTETEMLAVLGPLNHFCRGGTSTLGRAFLFAGSSEF